MLLPFWNPEHRLQKSMLNLVVDLAEVDRTAPPYSLPYLGLLNLAASMADGSTKAFTRFIVTRHRRRANADRQMVFESRTHAL